MAFWVSSFFNAIACKQTAFLPSRDDSTSDGGGVSEEGSASLFRKRLVNDLCSCLLLRIAFLLFSLGPPLSLSVCLIGCLAASGKRRATKRRCCDNASISKYFSSQGGFPGFWKFFPFPSERGQATLHPFLPSPPLSFRSKPNSLKTHHG